MGKPFFSIGIIFKNEIRCLERCIKSLQPLRDAVPCELVMADTGSTDGSHEIAARYADVLFDFPWIDDFAAARNAVMDRCSGRWYISVDADEWLVKGVEEMTAFSKVDVSVNFACYHIRNLKSCSREDDDNYLDFIATRMARLSTGIRYEGRIHENWKDPKSDTLHVATLDKTWFYHDGYLYASKADEEAKRERNWRLLERKLKETPDDLLTLMECIDNVKHSNPERAAEYVRRAVHAFLQR